ncbi:SDR family oxidoreductase [Kitasatospora sp. NPDC006697]|uniref:SDR family oxidoreductase n=1 Tax=Kitasatospora sp. NPDC006697 TaxID=3364020 RepID=UPI0036A32F79
MTWIAGRERDIAVPDQSGRLAVVTGATSGIGYHTARRLALAGAEVVLAVRDTARGESAAARIRSNAPGAGPVSVARLDLASLASVRGFAAGLLERGTAVDILVNNAGVMAVPVRRTTEDGFELQFGTNHLGHFALTGLLLPLLREARAARVVSVSSVSAWLARLDLDDLNSERRYNGWQAYGQSKLANLVFALELHRLAFRQGWPLRSIAAHPGATRTNLATSGPLIGRRSGLPNFPALAMSVPVVTQDAARGALPSLVAATGVRVAGGAYYGPGGPFGLTGLPAAARVPSHATDRAKAEGLWEASERLTGVAFTR